MIVLKKIIIKKLPEKTLIYNFNRKVIHSESFSVTIFKIIGQTLKYRVEKRINAP